MELKHMVNEARDLLEPGEAKSNPEYLRGMCELIARCYPSNDVDTPTRAAQVADMILGPFYVWLAEDGSCDNVSNDITEARRWRDEFIAEGREAYITCPENVVID